MTKAVSRDLAVALSLRLGANIDWGQFDPDVLQSGVVDLSPAELGKRMTAFLKNDCRLQIKGPSALMIDRTKPFDPEKFIGSGWTMGEQDERALFLTEIDFSNVRFESGLRDGESTITGVEKLARLTQGGLIRPDAKTGQALHEEKGQATLRFLYDTYRISWMEFAGSVLRRPGGYSGFLYLCRDDDGSWAWDYYWLDYGRGARSVSPLLASPLTSAI